MIASATEGSVWELTLLWNWWQGDDDTHVGFVDPDDGTQLVLFSSLDLQTCQHIVDLHNQWLAKKTKGQLPNMCQSPIGE